MKPRRYPPTPVKAAPEREVAFSRLDLSTILPYLQEEALELGARLHDGIEEETPGLVMKYRGALMSVHHTRNGVVADYSKDGTRRRSSVGVFADPRRTRTTIEQMMNQFRGLLNQELKSGDREDTLGA